MSSLPPLVISWSSMPALSVETVTYSVSDLSDGSASASFPDCDSAVDRLRNFLFLV